MSTKEVASKAQQMDQRRWHKPIVGTALSKCAHYPPLAILIRHVQSHQRWLDRPKAPAALLQIRSPRSIGSALCNLSILLSHLESTGGFGCHFSSPKYRLIVHPNLSHRTSSIASKQHGDNHFHAGVHRRNQQCSPDPF